MIPFGSTGHYHPAYMVKVFIPTVVEKKTRSGGFRRVGIQVWGNTIGHSGVLRCRYTRVISFNYFGIQGNRVLLGLTQFTSSFVTLSSNLLSFNNCIILCFLVSDSRKQHYYRHQSNNSTSSLDNTVSIQRNELNNWR